MLTEHLVRLLPRGASVLDIGCGDGSIDVSIKQARPDVEIKGIDTMVRKTTGIPVTPFDGATIPFTDKSFDVVMFADVLHHTNDPLVLLREAKRVARQVVVLKDHTCDGAFDGYTLRLMDWVGNAPYGVALPYNYWSEQQWRRAFDSLDLKMRTWSGKVGLYPWPASLLFDRSLHFVATLTP